MIEQYCGYQPQLSTDGGTSDGRFIAKMGAQIVELGPLNATIHKVDECVSVADLQKLSLVNYAKNIIMNPKFKFTSYIIS